MTEPARDSSVPAPSPWVPAILAGAAAFLCVGALALLIGTLEWLAAGRPFGVRLTWKLAGLYVGLFHGAGVEVRAGLPTAAGTSTDTPIDLSGLTTVHVTLLLGTISAGAALWRAGRSVALRASRRRIWWGAAIAPSYAVLSSRSRSSSGCRSRGRASRMFASFPGRRSSERWSWRSGPVARVPPGSSRGTAEPRPGSAAAGA